MPKFRFRPGKREFRADENGGLCKQTQATEQLVLAPELNRLADVDSPEPQSASDDVTSATWLRAELQAGKYTSEVTWPNFRKTMLGDTSRKCKR